MKQKKAANYLLVALKNGKVVVSLHGRRKEDLVSAGSVNDGHWHRVHIVKDKRKVVVMLDDFAPLRAKAPNKLQLDGQLFVGGLPESSPLLDNAAAKGNALLFGDDCPRNNNTERSVLHYISLFEIEF